MKQSVFESMLLKRCILNLQCNGRKIWKREREGKAKRKKRKGRKEGIERKGNGGLESLVGNFKRNL